MSTRFAQIIAWLFENVFDFTTILVAAILVIRYQIKPPELADIPEITTWILAVLGLMAISGIWERNRRLSRIESHAKDAREFAKQFVDSALPASRFFQKNKLHQFHDTIFASSQSIDILGTILGRTTREYMSVLQERIRSGAKLRVIICDPTIREVVNQIALREFGDFPPANVKERLEGAEAYVRGIAKVPHKQGAIQIGFLPFVPSFGQISIDSNKPQGLCYVEIYHHRTADSNPVFEVRQSNDATWHTFFVQQFELLWACCRIEAL